jgi:serine-type D-Ala-D-Ala carboxypeptidase/endopeptidase (penicillin-binding protein 4)
MIFKFFIAFYLFASLSQGAEIKTYCSWDGSSEGQISGRQIESLYEIASISKVLTSFWLIREKTFEYRFKTRLHFKRLENNTYDLFIQGGRDPMFSRENLQFIIAQLNARGINKIRNLSFDANFSFFEEVRSSLVAQGFFRNQDPGFERIRRELNSFLSQINKKNPFPERIKFSVENIISENEFATSYGLQFDFSLEHKSVPAIKILKEMNRNSNNHAANQIFEMLGGRNKFAEFIYQELSLTNRDLVIYNGSGDRMDGANGEKYYNQATCRALVKIIRALQIEILKQTNHLQSPLGLQDLLSVAGVNSPNGEASTVSNLYGNDLTEDAVIAKTGTVNPSVALAGLASTMSGEYYFVWVYGTNGTRTDWIQGRQKIRSELNSAIRNWGGPRPLHYQAHNFVSFDEESKLTDSNPSLIQLNQF